MKKVIVCLFLMMAFSLPVRVLAADKPNLNSVTQSELAADPAVGDDLARKITELRSDMGDFTGWDDLKEVEGMTDAKLQQLKERFQIIEVENTDCNC